MVMVIKLNKIYCEPCLDTLGRMDDKSIDCVITSPPYWQLRDYGYEGQWGLESTFHLYLEHLWSLMDEIWRVLKDEGTVWINLGDTYTGSNGFGTNQTKWRDADPYNNKNYAGNRNGIVKIEDIKPKCLLLIPHRFAIGCIERGWIMRNDVIWAKRNGMPESVTDRFSKKHEYIFFIVKSEDYYFDLDAIRDKSTTPNKMRNKSNENYSDAFLSPLGKGSRPEQHPNGKNPGSISDFWDIPTKPSSEEHYAQYNEELLKKPILAGCPEFVCNKCGKPRKKIIENTPMVIKRSDRREKMGQANGTAASGTMVSPAYSKVTGLTDCGCNAGFSGGIIYDPFMGTGSTAEVALRSNRNFIGSEMKKEYCEIAEKRLVQFQQNKLF